MKPTDSKINALKSTERPHDIKGIRSYLGMVNYLKHFIPDFIQYLNISTKAANTQKH